MKMIPLKLSPFAFVFMTILSYGVLQVATAEGANGNHATCPLSNISSKTMPFSAAIPSTGMKHTIAATTYVTTNSVRIDNSASYKTVVIAVAMSACSLFFVLIGLCMWCYHSRSRRTR